MTTVRFRIRKGLDLPVAGAPQQTIEAAAAASSVALIGADYAGLKPRLGAEVGDRVRLGQSLFVDKRDPDVHYCAPGAGVVKAINRGARRTLQSIIIELDGNERVTFPGCDVAALARLDPDLIAATLCRSGMWTALRERPFNRVARTDTEPHALFVTAMDTNPLAPDPAVVIGDAGESFVHGLTVLARLTGKPVYLCQAAGADLPRPQHGDIRAAEFSGPHPAGLAGTHIHFLDPVGAGKTVWHINYQDVMAVGELFVSGEIAVARVVSLAGPMVARPRLLRTRLGAATDDLVEGELRPGGARVVSGSLLDGRHAAGWARYLGRYHLGVAAIAEPRGREFLGWFAPGLDKFSANRVYVSHLLPGRRFDLDTSQQGSSRAIVPVGHYEKVVPLDVLPTPLLKSLIVRDTDTAQALGCLELAEEDLALCSLVCCSKQDFGAALRASLEKIEREG